MEGEEFGILNNIISTKKITDDLLEQQILENENSFEFIGTKVLSDNNEKNKNGSCVDENIKNNNEEKNIKEGNNKKEEKNENDMNGLNYESLDKKDTTKESDKNKTTDIKENNNIEYKKIDIQKYKDEEKSNEPKKVNNKRKMNKKNTTSNSIDSINRERNRNNENKNLSAYKSIEYKRNKNDLYYANLSVHNKVNIYQRLFDIKMRTFENLKLNKKKRKIKFNLDNNLENPKEIIINSPSAKSIFSDDEIIQGHRNDKMYKKQKTSKTIYNSPNQIAPEYLEEDVFSLKSKKSKINRQNSLNSSMSNNSSEKFFQTYERFKENQQKQKEKLEYLKKVKEDNENKICYFKPKINKKSKRIKEDFYTRQQKKLDDIRKKNEELKLKLKKEEEKELYLHTISKRGKLADVSKTICKLYEWENNRKQKINEKQKSVNEKTKKEILKKPKINKNSQKLVILNYYQFINKKPNIVNHDLNAKDKESFFERLILDEKKRKERQTILNQIYSPTFTPNLHKHINHNQSLDYLCSPKNKRENAKTRNAYNINNKDVIYNNTDDTPNFCVNVSFAQQIRNRLFKNINSHRNKSSVNLMKINEINNEENSDNNIKNVNDNNKKDSDTYSQKYKNFDINIRLEMKNKNGGGYSDNKKENLVNNGVRKGNFVCNDYKDKKRKKYRNKSVGF